MSSFTYLSRDRPGSPTRKQRPTSPVRTSSINQSLQFLSYSLSSRFSTVGEPKTIDEQIKELSARHDQLSEEIDALTDKKSSYESTLSSFFQTNMSPSRRPIRERVPSYQTIQTENLQETYHHAPISTLDDFRSRFSAQRQANLIKEPFQLQESHIVSQTQEFSDLQDQQSTIISGNPKSLNLFRDEDDMTTLADFNEEDEPSPDYPSTIPIVFSPPSPNRTLTTTQHSRRFPIRTSFTQNNLTSSQNMRSFQIFSPKSKAFAEISGESDDSDSVPQKIREESTKREAIDDSKFDSGRLPQSTKGSRTPFVLPSKLDRM